MREATPLASDVGRGRGWKGVTVAMLDSCSPLGRGEYLGSNGPPCATRICEATHLTRILRCLSQRTLVPMCGAVTKSNLTTLARVRLSAEAGTVHGVRAPHCFLIPQQSSRPVQHDGRGHRRVVPEETHGRRIASRDNAHRATLLISLCEDWFNPPLRAAKNGFRLGVHSRSCNIWPLSYSSPQAVHGGRFSMSSFSAVETMSGRSNLCYGSCTAAWRISKNLITRLPSRGLRMKSAIENGHPKQCQESSNDAT